MQFDAQLVLCSGEVFHGKTLLKQEKPTLGEVVFNTGMVGYMEALTDPSYAGQILVFTYPLIGNYGVANKSTWESERIRVNGVVVSELSSIFSNHTAERSLLDCLENQAIPVLTGIDTRALTKCLRTKGVVPGAITAKDQPVQYFGNFGGTHWVKEVSIKEPIHYGMAGPLVILVDCGMKENILRELLKFPIRIKRVPFDYDYTEEPYDAVFLSNGPGDPIHCQETIRILRVGMQSKKPIFGICLGTQLMALAAGAKTYKLPFGHRSQNQPCLHLKTNRCYLTSQNHGFAIDETSLPADWHVTFRNLNDQSVAGIEHAALPYFSVQFHPEAAPGPTDTQWLFESFYHRLSGMRLNHAV